MSGRSGCAVGQLSGRTPRLRVAPAPNVTYLVHGEPEAAAALRDRIDRSLGWTAVVPRSGERVLVR
ncbi:MBL fold metallo-hydrolase RNA specificity domain-containing protein [Streptomyces sp. SLBN-8D4]|uniref:MBL fold metallo-hydrolase RNA specificity domain-containing protein n=1 Tax=Streptomyces sp. SLBN-8D4 TaxID=3377728 RepID=UPI003C7E3265